MDSIIDKSEAMRDKSSEGYPNAVLQFPSDPPPFDKEQLGFIKEYRKYNYREKGAQTKYDKCFYDSFDMSSDKPFDDSSSSVSSDDTDAFDIRESERYIASSDEERRRLIEEQSVVEKRSQRVTLLRKLKAGKKAEAKERRDSDVWRAVSDASRVRDAAFEAEALKVRQSRAAEDRARDLSRAVGADGRKWSGTDQRALELQRVNDDFIKLGVELLRLRYGQSEGERTLRFKADRVTKLLNLFDGQWREAYQRIGDNAVKLHNIQSLDATKKEAKAADETLVQPDKKRPKTKPHPTNEKPGTDPSMAAEPARKPAKQLRQHNPPPQKLRRSKRLLAREEGKQKSLGLSAIGYIAS